MDDTTDELMEATSVVLRGYGCASLGMPDIADGSTRSIADLHYHDGNKQDLLDSSLVYCHRRSGAHPDVPFGETAGQRLLQERIGAVAEDGQECVEFDADSDPAEVAAFHVTAHDDVQIRRIAVGHPPGRTRQVPAESNRRLLGGDDPGEEGGTLDGAGPTEGVHSR